MVDIFISYSSNNHDPNLAPLRGTPEFEELMKDLEEKIAKEQKSLQ